MPNYYSSQRSVANSENGRLIEITDENSSVKSIAIFPFYMRKMGNINAWEFSATTTENEQEVGVMPKNFRAILFSCVQAFMDYMKDTYDLTLSFSFLKHKVNKIEEAYFPPATYISEKADPSDFIIIANRSVRDGDEYSYPIPNCVPVGFTEGDRSYQGDDAEYFWRADDGCYYLGLVEFLKDVQPQEESAQTEEPGEGSGETEELGEGSGESEPEETPEETSDELTFTSVRSVIYFQ